MTTNDFFALFTYGANWNIPLNLFFLAGAIVYWICMGPLAPKLFHAKPVSAKQKSYFFIGWLIYYLALGSPLSLLAHQLFSMHMLQMSLLYFVMPPFLLLGLPSWVFRPLLKFRWVRKIGSFLTKPLIVLFLFNGSISVYHFPYVFDSIMESMFLHYLSHAILLLLALCVWWPVVCPVSELDRVKPLHKLAFIFANGVLLTPACALIIFADEPLFASYQQLSGLEILPALQDQALGGVIMKITQEIVYITAIGFVLSQWFRLQRQRDEQEMEEWKTGGVTTDPAISGKKG